MMIRSRRLECFRIEYTRFYTEEFGQSEGIELELSQHYSELNEIRSHLSIDWLWDWMSPDG